MVEVGRLDVSVNASTTVRRFDISCKVQAVAG